MKKQIKQLRLLSKEFHRLFPDGICHREFPQKYGDLPVTFYTNAEGNYLTAVSPLWELKVSTHVNYDKTRNNRIGFERKWNNDDFPDSFERDFREAVDHTMKTFEQNKNYFEAVARDEKKNAIERKKDAIAKMQKDIDEMEADTNQQSKS